MWAWEEILMRESARALARAVVKWLFYIFVVSACRLLLFLLFLCMSTSTSRRKRREKKNNENVNYSDSCQLQIVWWLAGWLAMVIHTHRDWGRCAEQQLVNSKFSKWHINLSRLCRFSSANKLVFHQVEILYTWIIVKGDIHRWSLSIFFCWFLFYLFFWFLRSQMF